ncbi:MAG: hypothetical protein E5W09_23705, partial [Mesorhizobium sp.]
MSKPNGINLRGLGLQRVGKRMDFSTFSGRDYFLIGGLILVGAGLLILSLIVNARVAHNVRHD